MRTCLLLAGAYNLVRGIFVVFFPLVPFRWVGLALPNDPSLCQCICMIVGGALPHDILRSCALLKLLG
jgi:hypothetical protein